MLVCGGRARDWEHLLWAGAWLASIRGPWLGLKIESRHLQAISAMFSLVYSEARWDFGSLLILTHGFLASDPRDKVYALLSLAGTTRNAPPTWPEALSPDYKEAVDRVYRRVTRHVLETTRDLLLLSIVNFDPDRLLGTGDCSWVPDFRGGSPPLALLKPVAGRGEVRLGRPVKASGSIPAQVRATPRPREIELRGARVAAVSWLGPAAGPRKIWRFINDLAVEQGLDSGEELDRMLRAAFDTLSYGGRLAPIPTAAQVLAHLAPHRDDLSRGRRHGRLVRLLFGSDWPEPSPDEDTSGVEIIAYRHARSGGRLFYTETGEVGQGPACTAVGDVVCVLFGGGAPFVLRPHDGRWILLGECYLPGWMNGEVVDKLDKGLVEEEWFTIR